MVEFILGDPPPSTLETTIRIILKKSSTRMTVISLADEISFGRTKPRNVLPMCLN